MMGVSFLSQGFQQVKRGKRETGKWKHVAHTGTSPVAREDYRGWQIEISSRKVGITVRHEQYNVAVRLDAKTNHVLSGYRSKSAAIAAAHHHIDSYYRSQRRHTLKGPHRKRPDQSNDSGQ